MDERVTPTILGVRETPPTFDVPKGACDCHVHVFGPPDRFPDGSGLPVHSGAGVRRRPSEAPARAALGPSRCRPTATPYGTDNSCLLETTQDVLEGIDFAATYTNAATSSVLAAARVPVVAPTARDAVALAYRTLTGVTPGQAKIVRIRNTLELHHIWMCEHLWEESSGRPDLRSISSPQPLAV